ncbi:MAG: glycosyltransferase family 4 protein [Actinomycetaceae bacterium]|nr:glycosyltransferase family 4 protein [Actinomycetaceae bacterium]
MKIGIVCPYSYDAPGGVQYHVSDLATELIRRGHDVNVLAPVETAEVPDFVTAVSGSYSVKYNGSVAQLSLGPKAIRETRAWLDRGFDVVHIHEPLAPSISLIALANAKCPIVATFHTSMTRSRAMELAVPILRPLLDRIAGRIAVSNEARRTLVEHQGGDAVIIPNGVYREPLATAPDTPKWKGTDEAPVIFWLGRLDEPRKGLHVLAGAIGGVVAAHPNVRFLIGGRGDDTPVQQLVEKYPDNVEFVGDVKPEQRNSLYHGATAYVAPQTGGESFGIVLVEAMSAGTCVIASDIEAFRLVLNGGQLGYLFTSADSDDLAAVINHALDNPKERKQLAAIGHEASKMYDWGVVTDKILAVYSTVIGSASVEVENTDTLLDNVRQTLGLNGAKDGAKPAPSGDAVKEDGKRALGRKAAKSGKDKQ